MSKVLITGATGFVGRNLVLENLKRGNKVRVLVRKGSPRESILKGLDLEIFYGNLSESEVLSMACKDQDIVFNCAALASDWDEKRLYIESNIKGVENICEASLKTGVKRLVQVSTNDVFGYQEGKIISETAPMRKWGEPYPDTKIEGEKIVWAYYHEKKLPVTVVYPCWIYGKGDRTFIPLTADSIIKKEMIFWRKNAHIWPTYIENLIDLMMLVSENDKAVGNGYLVHDGEVVYLEDLCRTLSDALKVPPVNSRIPYPLAYLVAMGMELLAKALKNSLRPLLTTYIVKNLGSKLEFSNQKAKDELDWTPKFTYQEGILKTIEWLLTLDLSKLKEK